MGLLSLWYCTVVVMVAFFSGNRICSAAELVYTCDSKIYCQGPILDAVHKLNLFSKDAKEYVDKPLKKSPEETLAAFYKKFPDQSNIDKEQLRNFLNDYFEERGAELIDHDPEDWTDDPPALQNIDDSTYRMWATMLNIKWKKLTKRIKDVVKKNPSHYSILDLPNPFVIPGGRFLEVYYWDAYWIIRGLLQSGMSKTVRGMIENYLHLVQKYGLIPNGGRVYYLQRSQPPFLAWMMNDYYEFTNDASFIKENVGILEKELVGFWEPKRSFFIELKNQTHRVFHYNTPSNVPRPESHVYDIEHAKNLPKDDMANLYSNIASSAESGWDFSSRWLQDKSTMRLQKTRTVLPVDLNALMCSNYKILANFYQIAGKPDKTELYMEKHESCKDTMMQVFYNETHGVWLDYHLDTEMHNTDFYPSNLSPLFTGCYKFENGTEGEAMRKILVYLRESKALKNGEGIPTSMRATGQQWDWPNAWAPLVHMTVIGLHNTGDVKLKQMANFIAEHWTRHNYKLYWQTKHMYEKYDIENSKVGAGGEYDPQEGFGWTNGVILDFLVKFSSDFEYKQKPIDVPNDDLIKHLLTYFNRRRK